MLLLLLLVSVAFRVFVVYDGFIDNIYLSYKFICIWISIWCKLEEQKRIISLHRRNGAHFLNQKINKALWFIINIGEKEFQANCSVGKWRRHTIDIQQQKMAMVRGEVIKVVLRINYKTDMIVNFISCWLVVFIVMLSEHVSFFMMFWECFSAVE